jgi:predicted lipoprotein with Yx(FWY)xxD motif
MKLRPLRVLVATAALLGGASIGAAGAGTGAPTVSARSSPVGEIIVGGGRTLYQTAAERKGVVACTGSCARRWPPFVLAAHAHPLAGPGVVASLLGTIERPDGRRQVTYHGLSLYFFSGDTRAGEVNGEGVGGPWHAVSPSGMAVTMTAAKSSAGATTTTTGSGSSTGAASSMSSGPPSGVNAGMWCAANPNSCVNGVPVPGGQ